MSVNVLLQMRIQLKTHRYKDLHEVGFSNVEIKQDKSRTDHMKLAFQKSKLQTEKLHWSHEYEGWVKYTTCSGFLVNGLWTKLNNGGSYTRDQTSQGLLRRPKHTQEKTGLQVKLSNLASMQLTRAAYMLNLRLPQVQHSSIFLTCTILKENL